MRIVISSGHGKYIRGASGVLDEVNEARRVVDRVAEYLSAGNVGVVVFHDNTSQSQSENLNRIVSFHNSQTRDLDVSVHFNAYQSTSKPMGTEVLYVTQSDLAAKTSLAISSAGSLINRGAKKRTDLAFLNNTNKPAILVETCFVDSSADADLYRTHFEAICQAIASATSGVSAPVPIPPEPEVPPDENPPVRRELAQGDTGADVAELQRILALPADGDFGPQTEAGVKAFQGMAGLPKDGVVGQATWAALDTLDARKKAGNDGISDELAAQIDQLVTNANIQISWPDRGKPPSGYYKGMAKTFALAVARYNAGDAAAHIMAEAKGNPDKDALAYYNAEFAAHGMRNDVAGLDTLRHLFVMMVGLGMRESSGDSWCGRDMSASNVQSDTAEAGLFQTSWNISNCTAGDEIDRLLAEYHDDPNGFQPTFGAGLSPSTGDLDVYGSGDGAEYQFLSKYAPAFHALVTAVGMRRLRAHWGPIGRREVDIMPAIDDLLVDVQQLVEGEPEPGPEPEPPPDQAVVNITIAATGSVKVIVNGQEFPVA